MSRKKNSLIYTIIAILFIIFSIFYQVVEPSIFPSVSNDIYEVTHVADGDTITVKDSAGQELKVRYIGMDTPESVKPNTPVQCFALKSSNYNKELVLGKEVKLEADVEDKDKYNRFLRYVYIDQNGDGNYDEMVNEILVKDGYAKVATFPPNVKYIDKFKADERFARNNNLGLWNECK